MRAMKTRKLCYLFLAVALVIILDFSQQKAAGDVNDFMNLNANMNCIMPSVILQDDANHTNTVYSGNTSAKISIDADSNSSTYNYSLNIVNNDASAWETRLECYSHTDINHNSTIILHNNATSSQQITISGGNITQTGEYYALAGNSTIHIGVTNLIENSPTGNTVLQVHLRIQTPDTTTYTLYVITFEFT